VIQDCSFKGRTCSEDCDVARFAKKVNGKIGKAMGWPLWQSSPFAGAFALFERLYRLDHIQVKLGLSGRHSRMAACHLQIAVASNYSQIQPTF
jgi:hypothetical protein